MSSIVFLLVSFLLLLVLVAAIVVIGNKHNGANWGHPGTNVLDGWLRLYCKKFHRQSGDKIELPIQGNFILISNHISSIDPFLLITAIDRPIRFMIAKEEYQRPFLNRMFRAAGCIPVDRGGRVEGAFRSALRAIKSGELVAIFPQGGIHCPEKPRTKIKPGIIKLSQLSGCAILPVRIKGVTPTSEILSSVVSRSHVALDVHPLISSEEVQLDDFRQGLSDWLVEKSDSIFLSEH